MTFGTKFPQPLPLSVVSHGALRDALLPEQKEAAARLPKRLKVLAWGENATVKGPVVLDLLPAAFAATQNQMGKDRVALDFQHNTLPGTEAYAETSEPRKVAGYGTPELVPGDGLYLSDIAWTPEGLAAALNFEDISPAPFLDERRRVVGLHSVALVRNGAVHGLHFFSATVQPPSESKKMTDEQLAEMAELKKTVMELKDLLSKMTDAKPVEALSASVTALAGTVEAMQRDALVDGATRDGKVIPLSAEEVQQTPLGTLKSIVAKLPAGVVPLSAATKPAAAPAPAALDATLESVAKVTGFSVDQLRSGNLTPAKKD